MFDQSKTNIVASATVRMNIQNYKILEYKVHN